MSSGGPMNTLITLAAVYIVFCAIVFFSQDRLLYFPDNAISGSPDAFGLRPWPGGSQMRGYISIRPPLHPGGTFLVWHGNAGAALQRTYFTEAMERRGRRVILLEYPGYGGRPGKPSEKSFVADAVAAAEQARSEFGDPVYLVGESLGCGVAAAAAGRCPWAGGAILITPWADLPSLAQAKYWYLPARWFVRDRYDSVKNLQGFAGPVAVLLAGSDEVVPVSHGQRLYNSLGGPKRLWVFPSAGHNTWPSGPDEKWWDEVLDFITAKH